MVNGNGLHNEEMINLIEGYSPGSLTQDHLNIIEMVLKINNKTALDALYALTKSVLKKSNSL